MRIAVSIFRWFGFGGLQRDCAQVLAECVRRGHDVHLYTMRLEGAPPPGVSSHVLSNRALTNHRATQVFARQLASELRNRPADVHLGFNKIPGLDVYFAGDSCFLHKAHTQRPPWYRWLPRFAALAANERALFAPDAATRLLMICRAQAQQFQDVYATPCARMTVLPPGIGRDRLAGADAAERRARKRKQLGWGAQDARPLLLFAGSGFRKKGLDRAVHVLAAQPAATLLVAGLDRDAAFTRLARRLGVADRLRLLGGRTDIADLMLAADVLVHPARDEAGGIVLVEALASGLPVVATAVCGFAEHVQRAGGGLVLPAPFSQPALDSAVAELLGEPAHTRCSSAGLQYARSHDLYGLAARVVDEIERRGAA